MTLLTHQSQLLTDWNGRLATTLLALGIVGSGCNKETPKGTNNAPTAVPPVSSEPGAEGAGKAATIEVALEQRTDIDDEQLEQAVLHRLFMDGLLPGTKVDLEAKDGIVRLKGSASSLYEKRKTLAVVRSTRGVRGFIDELEVEPSAVPNPELQQRVSDALLFDAATEAFEVKVEAEDGRITLSGEVDSWAERALAEDVAGSVRGVTEIENRLTVSSPPVRLAGEIQREVTARLDNDVLVDTALVEVEVEGGVVHLSGIVGSMAERQRAIAKSWTDGVERVEAQDLIVEWWNRDRFEKSDLGGPRADEDIERAVTTALNFDSRIRSHAIDISVNRGVVTLQGSVGSAWAQRLAAEVARDTLGVQRVRNHLLVLPVQEIAEGALTRRVERAIDNNPFLTSFTGDVDVHGGIVHLTGTVSTQREKREASAVAERVMGVTHVENDLDVLISQLADRSLEDDVREELFWNVFVPSDQVHVSASRGMVKLTGEVDDLRAYRQSAKAARRAGAEIVFNDLEIKDPS